MFSGKPHREQFRDAELDGCGAKVLEVYSNAVHVGKETIAARLKEGGDKPLLILTTYSSLTRIHEALAHARKDEPGLGFTTCCFDEAHNLHTESRRRLWDVEEHLLAEEASEEEDEQMPDADEFTYMYPWRLYATATPRPQMKNRPEIYGDFEEDWVAYWRCSCTVALERLLEGGHANFSVRQLIPCPP